MDLGRLPLHQMRRARRDILTAFLPQVPEALGRAALDVYWQRVSRAAAFSPLQRSLLDRMMGRWTLNNSPAFLAMDMISRIFSPYDLNPTGFNPLRQVLAESINFERLATSPTKLFITATNVHTGRGKIFRNGQITPDVLLASASLPTMFRAVEIDGEPYWDGGYAGNPTITPLVRESDARDTILVQINPRERLKRRPRRARSSTASTRFPSIRLR